MKNCAYLPYRSRTPGFTLIELLVVVIVIAVIASVAMPALMKLADRKSVLAAKKELMMAEYDAPDPEIATGSQLPMVESFSADWVLSSHYQRVGLEVYSRYQLTGTGAISFRAHRNATEAISLEIPFPSTTVEASNVYLRFIDPETGQAMEPEDVIYHQHGIFWTGTLPPNQTVEAEYGFSALGTEVVEISLPPARRLSNVNLTLDLGPSAARQISNYSLIPTDTKDQSYHWVFGNLVSDRNIQIKIPGAASTGGRLITLLRFMAVAVFLFGAGFLYMNEAKAPRRLDEFRLGHFSLLALTYSLFFILFAVIIYREQVGVLPALLISAACSLPLLVIHVARITDLGFAVWHILPLAVASLALVVLGVYGGDLRDYGFLVLLICLTAYLTVTYQPKKNTTPNALPA